MVDTSDTDACSVRFIFVRHGQTEANAEERYMGHQDSPLSAKGQSQAVAVATRLKQEGLGSIYTSDLGRAAMTASIISEACGIPLVADERLRERHAGVFQGMLRSEMQTLYPEHFAIYPEVSPDFAIPGGESARQVLARISPFLDEARLRHHGQTVAIVTHGGVIRTVLWHFLSAAYASTYLARVENTSLNVFRYRNGSWVLEAWNDTGHLQEQ